MKAIFKSRLIEFKWGLISILMVLLWMLLERMVGLHDQHIDKHSTYTNLIAIVWIVIYVVALRQKRQVDFDGTMTYLQGFLSGFIITLIVTVFSPLTQYIISTFITPNYFANVSAYAVSKGMMSEANAAEYFTYQNYVVQATVGALLMGTLTSAIVAFFMRKK